MKKFTLKKKHRGKLETRTIIVDDEDAYLLRTNVFPLTIRDLCSKEIYNVITYISGNTGIPLSHMILNVEDGIKIYHKNGDTSDFRRENLSSSPDIQREITRKLGLEQKLYQQLGLGKIGQKRS